MIARKNRFNSFPIWISVIIATLLLACPELKSELVKFEQTEVFVEEGSSVQLKPVIEGMEDYDIALTWESSDESIATVDEDGQVTGIKASDKPITITVTANDISTLSAKAQVTVVPVPVISRLIIPPFVESLEVGSTIQLEVVMEGIGNFDKGVTWKSLDESIATVDERGKVTGVKASDVPVDITATANADKTMIAKTQITVVPKPAITGVILDLSRATVDVLGDINLRATVKGIGNFNRTVKWESSDDEFATVDENGKVSGVKERDNPVIITAIAQGDTSKRASAEITVVKKDSIVVINRVVITPSEESVEIRSSVQLEATVEGLGNFDKSVTWESSNKAIALVDEDGKVTGIKISDTPVSITATANGDTSKSATVKITVIPKPAITKISISPEVEMIEQNSAVQLKATVEGVGKFDQSVKWESSNKLIAAVNEHGKVVGLRGGSSVLIVATANGDTTKSASVEIFVTPVIHSVEVIGDTITLSAGETRKLTAEAKGRNGAVLKNIPFTWNSVGKIPAGTTLNPKTGELKAGRVGGSFAVIVKVKGKETVSGSIVVNVVAKLPSLLSLGFEHPDTSAALIYSRDGALQTELPSTDELLNIHVPANYMGLDLRNCIMTFEATNGARVTAVTSGGHLLESGVSSLDFTIGAIEIVVSKGPLSRRYAVKVQMSSYAVIPDDSFRDYLKGEVGSAFVGNFLDITHPEIAKRDFLNCMRRGIASLEGVAFFTGITSLTCSHNQLRFLDISANTELEELYCNNNQLSSLDLSKNTKLHTLYSGENQLSSLDFSANTELYLIECNKNKLHTLELRANKGLGVLVCAGNQLKTLDVSANTRLGILACFDNELNSLDVSNNRELTGLSFFDNKISSIDLSNNKKLTMLYCGYNKLSALDVSHSTELEEIKCEFNQLSHLDVSKNTKLSYLLCERNQLKTLKLGAGDILEKLKCGGNQLSSLDVSNNASITILKCQDNQLSSLDVSNNAGIVILECYNNQLNTLDLSENHILFNLDCSSNKLTVLDVSHNPALSRLICSYNQLSSLDVSANPLIKQLFCDENLLTSLDLSANGRLEKLSCNQNRLVSLDISSMYDSSDNYLSICATNGILNPISTFKVHRLCKDHPEVQKLLNTRFSGVVPTVSNFYLYTYRRP